MQASSELHAKATLPPMNRIPGIRGWMERRSGEENEETAMATGQIKIETIRNKKFCIKLNRVHSFYCNLSISYDRQAEKKTFTLIQIEDNKLYNLRGRSISTADGRALWSTLLRRHQLV
jgi:hypothetical protein